MNIKDMELFIVNDFKLFLQILLIFWMQVNLISEASAKE